MKGYIQIISFSARKHGNCGNIADFISEHFSESVHNNNVFVRKFSDFVITPCGRCDYECMQNAPCPQSDDMEKTLLEEVIHSQTAIYIIPNYCDYPCANFFVFNERSLGCFYGKPKLLDDYINASKKFIVISSSNAEHIKQTFCQHTNKNADVLVLISKAFGLERSTDDLLSSPQARKTILSFVTPKADS